MATTATNARVFINGQDISHHVHGLQLDAQVGSAIAVRLDLFVVPQIRLDEAGNMIVEMDLAPDSRLRAGLLDSPLGRLRGIVIREEDER